MEADVPVQGYVIACGLQPHWGVDAGGPVVIHGQGAGRLCRRQLLRQSQPTHIHQFNVRGSATSKRSHGYN